ncbi:MAG: hypothetical protein HY343_08865 [Lentisphaerae bacterium]|nr:hypothetical protein [Lentisphaerota bacterium]
MPHSPIQEYCRLTTDVYGGFLELGFEGDRARVISGTALETLEIQSLTIGGRPVPVESL